jgi:hypothetical protein
MGGKLCVMVLHERRSQFCLTPPYNKEILEAILRQRKSSNRMTWEGRKKSDSNAG